MNENSYNLYTAVENLKYSHPDSGADFENFTVRRGEILKRKSRLNRSKISLHYPKKFNI